MAYEPDLPDELQDNQPQDESGMDPEELLAAIGQAVAKKRDEAVTARRESGIEATWLACEEAYLCIDDANRHEYEKAKWAKPMAIQGPVQTEKSKPSDGRSTVFVRLTARYVDMGAAKIAEIVLPIDGKAFSIKPTPIPDSVSPFASVAKAIQDMGETPVGQAINPVSAAEKAEKRIYDWMVEADYRGQMKKVLEDSARIGVGVLKGPVPTMRKKRAVSKGMIGGKTAIKIERRDKVVPDYKWTDPWFFYPSGSCGEDIHSGEYCFEKDSISSVTLKKLKREVSLDGKPIYLSSQIDKVLQQGPDGHKDDDARPNHRAKKDNFTIWYGYCTLTRDEMKALDATGLDELPDEVTEIPAIVTLVNDSVIRATRNTNDNGRFPYNVVPWSKRSGSWAGVGVGEQVSTPQKIVNNGSRAVFNNAGVSAGVQIIIDPAAVIPANGQNIITPNKLWYIQPGQTVEDVRKVFAAVEIPNITQQLMPIIQYGMKLAEEASNIPLISQGQDGQQRAPQTYGEAQLQNSNANTLLRSLAASIDGYVTTPVVNDSYEWLLLDPEVPDDEKGDFDIECTGSITLVENAIQEQTLIQMEPIVKDPEFGMDPEKWAMLMLKAKRINPEAIMMDDKKKAERAKNVQPPPQVLAAQISAKSRTDAATISAQANIARAKADQDRDTMFVNAESQANQLEHESRTQELNMKWQLAQLEYASKHNMKLEDVKAALAQTAMRLNTERELTMATLNTDLHKHHNPEPGPAIQPLVEVPGKAPAGQSFSL
jgi:hypothetical protein